MGIPSPINRQDFYYSYLINGTGHLPEPIDRIDHYLYYLCVYGFPGGGGTITPEQINAAVDAYLATNPVDVPTKTSDLENDSGYIESEFKNEQDMIDFLNGENEDGN